MSLLILIVFSLQFNSKMKNKSAKNLFILKYKRNPPISWQVSVQNKIYED